MSSDGPTPSTHPEYYTPLPPSTIPLQLPPIFGMTYREWVAGQCVANIFANNNKELLDKTNADKIAKAALKIADSLIAHIDEDYNELKKLQSRVKELEADNLDLIDENKRLSAKSL